MSSIWQRSQYFRAPTGHEMRPVILYDTLYYGESRVGQNRLLGRVAHEINAQAPDIMVGKFPGLRWTVLPLNYRWIYIVPDNLVRPYIMGMESCGIA